MSKRLTVILLASMIVLCGGVFATEKGPLSDVIYFNVKMSQELGLRDVAEGLTDIFMEGVSDPVLMGMGQATRDKMDIYSVPALTYALFVNPYPNEAPYAGEVNGKDFFNVMAINEFRYALNDLINRQYIVDEILGGAGGQMLSMATPGQPATYKYGLVANKLGLSFEGNETRALEVMKKAFEDAAKIPENQGRLVNRDGKWYFDGEPGNASCEADSLAPMFIGASLPRMFLRASLLKRFMPALRSSTFFGDLRLVSMGTGHTKRDWLLYFSSRKRSL